MSIPKVDPDLCTGCGICEDICPDVFEIGDDGLSHVIDPNACEDAGCCGEAADECPEGAITIEQENFVFPKKESLINLVVHELLSDSPGFADY